MPLAFAACKPGRDILEISGATMGTTYHVVALNDAGISRKQAQTAINTALSEVNNAMSNWQDDSEISRFNAGNGTGAVTVSPALAEVMQAAEAVHLASEGTFDTTMGPLIELWGFGAPGTTALPQETEIRAAQARAGHRNTLRVGAGQMQKRQDDAQVYLAAIGKGFGADHIGRALSGLGITNFMVEIGGDLVTAGVNPDGKAWQIGVESPNPLDRNVLDVVGVSGKGLASSGDYRNYFEQDGKRYSHVIDPTTGRPITHKTAAVTVLADNAMLADAWATAMLVLGRERGLEVAEKQGLAVLFVDHAGDGFKTHMNAGFKALKA